LQYDRSFSGRRSLITQVFFNLFRQVSKCKLAEYRLSKETKPVTLKTTISTPIKKREAKPTTEGSLFAKESKIAASEKKDFELGSIAKIVMVTDYLSHSEYLGALYNLAKSKIPGYTYLKFAFDLGFSHTNVMRLVIAQQRTLTIKAARKIAKHLEFHGTELRYWLTLVEYSLCSVPTERQRLFRLLVSNKSKTLPEQLNEQQAEYFSAWYHPVIREMVLLDDFRSEVEWIQKRLAFPLRADQIKRSMELIIELGLVYKNPQTQKFEQNGNVRTPAEVDNLALVGYHQKMMEAASESITRVHEDLRDIQSVTLALPSAAVSVLKGKIGEWVSELLLLEAEHISQEEKEVFQVNLQLFPFTLKK
jgi:uncharacterized protein (TIGR02147 family)